MFLCFIDMDDLADDFLFFSDKISDTFYPSGSDLRNMDEPFFIGVSRSSDTNAPKPWTLVLVNLQRVLLLQGTPFSSWRKTLFDGFRYSSFYPSFPTIRGGKFTAADMAQNCCACFIKQDLLVFTIIASYFNEPAFWLIHRFIHLSSSNFFDRILGG